MLGKLIDVNHHKTTTEAIGFYIVSLMILIGFSTLLFHVLGKAGIVSGVGTFFEGGTMHTLVGTGFVLVLSTMILSGRKRTSDLFSILLVITGVYLAFTTSVILGMIPVTLLTIVKK